MSASKRGAKRQLRHKYKTELLDQQKILIDAAIVPINTKP